MRRAVVRTTALCLTLLSASCLYGFSGGGGLPEHIKTIAVPPVQNQTERLVLAERMTQGLLQAVQERLGAQVASEEQADAVIDVRLTEYREEALSFEGREEVGANVFQRRVSVRASVEIQDRLRERTLWESSAVSGVGEYNPEEETEEAALDVAVENLIQKIVNGAQSQW
jgi:hypothetical protein